MKASERKQRVLHKFQARRQTPHVDSRRMRAFPPSSGRVQTKSPDRSGTFISYNIVSQTGLPDVFGDYLPGRSSGLGHGHAHQFGAGRSHGPNVVLRATRMDHTAPLRVWLASKAGYAGAQLSIHVPSLPLCWL